MMNIQTRALLLELLNFSTHRKITLFIVGGSLRDHCMRKKISDIDLTGKNIAALATQFAKSLNFTCVPLDKTPGRATTRIILPNQEHWDCTDLQGNKIEEDLSQRDFTINAMGQVLSNFLAGGREIIDPFDGQKDIAEKTIRTTASSVLKSDPLRMLRAFRFAATLKFTIEEKTLKEISQHKEDIAKTARERVWQEFSKFFSANSTGELVDLMRETGLLPCLLPVSFENWKNLLDRYTRLEDIFLNKEYPIQTHDLSKTEKALLKLSILLKDNFDTEKTDDLLRTLKASNSEVAFICKSIENSYFLSQLSSDLNDSSLYDICVTCGDKLLPGILLQACALPSASQLASYTEVLEFYFSRYLPVAREKALLNGDDLIKIFNISPSSVLGEVLQNIQRAQVLGTVKTPAEAEALAAKTLKP